jgi:transposase-like protein
MITGHVHVRTTHFPVDKFHLNILSVVARLKESWADDYARWQRRDLSVRHYVYVWADGVYLQARMEPVAECMLVMIGATPEGKKELLGFQVGVRESS